MSTRQFIFDIIHCNCPITADSMCVDEFVVSMCVCVAVVVVVVFGLYLSNRLVSF